MYSLPLLRIISISCAEGDTGGGRSRWEVLQKLKSMADSRAQLSANGPPCTVAFALVDNTCTDDRDSDNLSDFDSDDSDDEKEDEENRL